MLEGVPDDLASILQKLTAKPQSERYGTAKELIDDLTGGTKLIGEAIRDDEAEANELAKQKTRKRRIKAAIACSLSLIICAVNLLGDPGTASHTGCESHRPSERGCEKCTSNRSKICARSIWQLEGIQTYRRR